MRKQLSSYHKYVATKTSMFQPGHPKARQTSCSAAADRSQCSETIPFHGYTSAVRQ